MILVKEENEFKAITNYSYKYPYELIDGAMYVMGLSGGKS
jgi:hypothetical protein